MRSLPAWAFWSIFVPLALLSPAIAFLLAIAAEIVVGFVLDAGTPAQILLAGGLAGLVLCRKLKGSERRRTEGTT